MRRLFAVAAAGAVAIGLAGASGPPNPPTPPAPAAIQTLVDQLGSERYFEREAAVAALEKIGAPALQALQAASRSDNPEVRERASKLLVKLKRADDSRTRLVAKRVKLEYKDTPLGSAVNDLRARTGLPIVLDANRIANPLRKVTCETAELPLWEALEAFCVAAELREWFVHDLELPKRPPDRRGFVPPPVLNADSVAIVLFDGKPDRLAADRSTAVRVAVLPSNYSGHKVTLGTGEVTLGFDVTPAPGLNWQEVVSVKVTRVIDSAGRLGGGSVEKTPPPFFDPTGTVAFGGAGIAMRFDQRGNPIAPESLPNPRVVTVPIKVATPSAKSLKRLEGVVYGEMSVLNQHLITITDLKKNTSTAFNGPGDLKFTVLEVKEPAAPGGAGTIRVQFEYPAPWVVNARRRGINPAFGFNPGWPEPPQSPALGRTIQAFDAAGKPFPLTTTTGGYSDISDDGMINIQTIQFSYRPETGFPAKLVVIGPKTVLVEVPFALENVPLP